MKENEARKETDWYVDRRPLDVLAGPHVPGFEVVSDDDAEWKCVARSKEIGQQISNAMNSYIALLEAAKPLIHFIEQFDHQPIKTADDFYGIHAGTEWEASLRLSDLRALRDAAALAEKDQPS